MRERIKQAAKKVHKAAKQIPSPVWGAAPRARKEQPKKAQAHYSDHIPARGARPAPDRNNLAANRTVRERKKPE